MNTPEPKPPILTFTKEWCMKMAELEGDSEIGVGLSNPPVVWMIVAKDGQREANVVYSPNPDLLTDRDRMYPANAPHRFIPLFTGPAIATEKTKVVPVRSEEEWREGFESFLRDEECTPDTLAWINDQGRYAHARWVGYLAALRSLGLVAATRDA